MLNRLRTLFCSVTRRKIVTQIAQFYVIVSKKRQHGLWHVFRPALLYVRQLILDK